MTSRVLILEDDEAFGALLGGALETDGYQVDMAASMARALQFLRARTYNILLLDAFIKVGARHEGAGMRLVQKVRRQKPEDRLVTPRSVPVIVMSDEVERGNGERVMNAALSVGADRTICKPFTHLHLSDMIAKLLVAQEAEGKEV